MTDTLYPTSDRVRQLREDVRAFMDAEIYPNEANLLAQVSAGESRWEPLP